MDISVQGDFKRARELFAKLPVATQRAQRRTLASHAFSAFKDQKRLMPQQIDRPTPFTRSAMRWSANAKYSEVFVKSIQRRYLNPIVFTGTRTAQRRFIFIPTRSQRTNPYGNMAKGRRRRALSDPKLFTRRRGRARLVFRRKPRGLEFLGVFVPAARYRKRTWLFYDNAIKHYDRHFLATYRREYDRAVARL